ncbi:MAG: YraN family protein [Phycisphaerae bacterium]
MPLLPFTTLVHWLIDRRAGGSVGQRGEYVAERHLRRSGLRILARNWACPLGEVDLVAREAGVLVFVEVKTRTSEEIRSPESQVNRAKRRNLTNVARFYVRSAGGRGKAAGEGPPVRFDIVAVILPPDGSRPTVRHHRSAFQPE